MKPEINIIKPPLGIYPHHLWISDRICEILCAIDRYIKDGKAIPIEWVEEYNKLIEEVHNG